MCGVFSTDTDPNMLDTSALSRSGFRLTISLELCGNFKKWGQNCVKTTLNYALQPKATAVADATVWVFVFFGHTLSPLVSIKHH